jgi:hypothetical protein
MQNQRSSLRGDQPQRGHRIRGPDGPKLFSWSASRSKTTEEFVRSSERAHMFSDYELIRFGTPGARKKWPLSDAGAGSQPRHTLNRSRVLGPGAASRKPYVRIGAEPCGSPGRTWQYGRCRFEARYPAAASFLLPRSSLTLRVAECGGSFPPISVGSSTAGIRGYFWCISLISC